MQEACLNGLWCFMDGSMDDGTSWGGHFDAETLDEAILLLEIHKDSRAKIISGGTDILRILKQKCLSELPNVLINLKTIQELAYIKEENQTLKIGALTSLSEIEKSALIRAKYNVLSSTAGVVGSPQIRNMATIAGSLCQDVKCWYYRAPKDYYHCFRKGGTICPAQRGDSRWMFSIFGRQEKDPCYATCQFDMAITLSALGACIKTTQRVIPIEKFFSPTFPGNRLYREEIITEIQVPVLPLGTKARYSKFAVRGSLDHPLVSVATVIKEKEARIVVGGVSIVPHIADEAADVLHGKEITEDLAEKAGALAVKNAAPFPMNVWKVKVMKALVKRSLLNMKTQDSIQNGIAFK